MEIYLRRKPTRQEEEKLRAMGEAVSPFGTESVYGPRCSGKQPVYGDRPHSRIRVADQGPEVPR